MAQDEPTTPTTAAPSGSATGATRVRPEVLAPAGDLAALRAALAAGADAVYFGLDDGFNARARAQNFPLAELRSVVARVHRAGAKAYVTLNTLVFEPELSEVERIVRGVAAAGADAIIVQDPAVALLARALCPELEVHASTQMTVASAQGARFAKDLGATRFVVPRELSVDEIRALAAETDLELEVFVHGALCVSWSGQCLTSEAWGGRSANRGQCAQSCRMPYELLVDGERRELGDVKYLLSPKDLAGARAVPELAAIGVHGLKIEGRQKGPQYVATATAGYRRWLDAIVGGKEDEAEPRLAADLQGMALSYTRGFGDGFLLGSDHQTLVEGRFPKHRGLLLGRVTQVRRGEVQIEPDDRDGRPWTGALAVDGKRGGPQGATKVSLPILGGSGEAASGPRIDTPAPRPGMGVVFDAGEPEDKQEPGGPIFRTEKRGRGWVLGFGEPGPDLSRVRPGQRVWITQDPTVARAADKVVETAPDGRIPLVLEVSGRAGSPLRVRARVLADRPLPSAVRALTAAAESEASLSPASARGLDEGTLGDKLGALGGTPFHLARLDASSLAPGLHLPLSELKPLRRALVEALSTRLDDPTREVALEAIAHVRASIPDVAARDEAPLVVPLCRSDEQLEAAIDAGVSEVELDWMELVGLSKAFARAKQAGLRVVVGGLRVEKPGEEGITERIARLLQSGPSSEAGASPDARRDGVLVRHWGAFTRFTQAEPRPFLVGDFSLNVTNSITARHVLSRGLDVVTASFDLDDAQLFGLVEATPRGRVAVVVHHRIPTFHTEHCLYAHLLSAGRDHRTCGRPCEQRRVDVRDHLGHEHPVIVDAGCRNTVFNHEPQSAASLVPGLLSRGVRRFRVDFVRESRHEARVILDAYRALLAGGLTPADVVRKLSVRDQFGVGAGRRTLLGASA